MNTKTIYFDESGFTGYNLLDPDQPIFVIASTDITPELAGTILKETFLGYQADEFKFTNIWRSKHKKRLLEFGKRIESLAPHIFIWANDKKFTVLAKIVDFLIEPYMTDAGYDFYHDGYCWKYTNYIHFGLTQIASRDLLTELVHAYQDFSREPSLHSLEILRGQLTTIASGEKEEIKIFFEQMALGANLFLRYHNVDEFKNTNELHLSAMIASISYWRQHHTEDFVVHHDASANFFRQLNLWEKITNKAVPEQMHPLGDGTEVEFPLRVLNTIPINSKNNFSIQLCDILAGLSARIFNQDTAPADRELLNNVIRDGLGEIIFDGIRPEHIFPDPIFPKKSKGPDAVDLMMQIINGSPNQ